MSVHIFIKTFHSGLANGMDSYPSPRSVYYSITRICVEFHSTYHHVIDILFAIRIFSPVHRKRVKDVFRVTKNIHVRISSAPAQL